MSDDRTLDELLCDYLEGELDPVRAQELQAMLARDPEKRQLLEQLRAARSTLRELPRETLPASAARAIRDHLEAPAPVRLFSTARLARIAAVVALTVGAGIAIWTALPNSAPAPAPLASSLHFEAPLHEMANGLAPSATESTDAAAEQFGAEEGTLLARADQDKLRTGMDSPEKKEASAGLPDLATPPVMAKGAPTGEAGAKAKEDVEAPLAMNQPASPKVMKEQQALASKAGPPANAAAPLTLAEPAGTPGEAPASAKPAPAAGPPPGFAPPASMNLPNQVADARASNANPQVIMVVTARDLASVRHQIDQVLAASQISVGHAPYIPMAQSTVNSAVDPLQQAVAAAVEQDRMQQARGAGGGRSRADTFQRSAPAVPAASGELRVARNVSQTQLQTIREKMVVLGQSRGVTISETDSSVAADSDQRLEFSGQTQSLRKQMPATEQRDLEQNLSQAQMRRGMREQQLSPQVQPQAAQQMLQSVDLTIVLQPQLPPGVPTGNLPASTPRR